MAFLLKKKEYKLDRQLIIRNIIKNKFSYNELILHKCFDDKIFVKFLCQYSNSFHVLLKLSSFKFKEKFNRKHHYIFNDLLNNINYYHYFTNDYYKLILFENLSLIKNNKIICYVLKYLIENNFTKYIWCLIFNKKLSNSVYEIASDSIEMLDLTSIYVFIQKDNDVPLFYLKRALNILTIKNNYIFYNNQFYIERVIYHKNFPENLRKKYLLLQ